MERPSSGLRRGKWTQEEEAYVERVIRDFNGGLLDAAPGTTLRSYLSDKLNCDPMRITKKFTGDASIGKRVFHPRENASPAAVERSRREIAELEATWRRKLEQQRREAEAADHVVGRRQGPAVDGLWLWGAHAAEAVLKLRGAATGVIYAERALAASPLHPPRGVISAAWAKVQLAAVRR